MPTVNYLPPEGFDYVSLVNPNSNSQFPVTPTTDDQIVFPEAISVSSNGTVTGPDGLYPLVLLQSSGAGAYQFIYALGEIEVGESAFVPPDDYNSVILQSPVSSVDWLFQPVAGDEVFYPNILTVTPNLDISGPDGNHTFYVIQEDGQAFTYSYVIAEEEPVEPTPDPVDILVPVSITVPDGWEYVTLMDVDPYLFQNWAEVPANGSQLAWDPLYGTFNSEGQYSGDYDGVFDLVFIDVDGTASTISFDTADIPVANEIMVSGTVNYLPPEGLEYVTLQDPIDPFLFNEWPRLPVAGEQLVFDPLEGTFDVNGNYTSDNENVHSARFIALDGSTNTFNVDTTGIQAFEEMPPQGNITFTVLETDSDYVLLEFAYDGFDADSFEYSINGSGFWQPAVSPILVENLDPDTQYDIYVRAINEYGTGQSHIQNVTTTQYVEPEPMPPTGIVTISTVSLTHNEASFSFTYSENDADYFEYQLNSGTWTQVTSPFTVSSLDPETQYNVSIRAVNADGSGVIYSETVTTEAEPVVALPPQGVVTFGTPDITHNSADITFSYDLNDETSFEYRINDGVWSTTTSPITLLDLDPDTLYVLWVRAVNAEGPGTAYDINLTTSVAPTVPSGVFTLSSQNISQTFAIIELNYSGNDHNRFLIREVGASFWTETTLLLEFMDLDPNTTYNYEVTAENDVGQGEPYAVSFTTEEIEATTPEIYLNGLPVMSILLNEEFNDPGAFAFDSHDGDITSLIQSTGSVNTAVAGQYEITYTVENSFNNSANITRIINVYDFGDIGAGIKSRGTPGVRSPQRVVVPYMTTNSGVPN